MTFVPYPGKFEIEPIKQESTFASMDKNFLEMGKVLQVGDGVAFVNVGDTVFFAAHGVWETPEVDGVIHYLVADSPEYVLGKIEA